MKKLNTRHKGKRILHPSRHYNFVGILYISLGTWGFVLQHNQILSDILAMEWLILYHGYDTWAPFTQYENFAMSWVNTDLFDCRVIQPKKLVVWLSTPAIWKASSIKIVLWFYHWTSCQQRLISKCLRIVPPFVSIKQIKCVAKQSLMEAHIGSTTWNPITQGLFIKLV